LKPGPGPKGRQRAYRVDALRGLNSKSRALRRIRNNRPRKSDWARRCLAQAHCRRSRRDRSARPFPSTLWFLDQQTASDWSKKEKTLHPQDGGHGNSASEEFPPDRRRKNLGLSRPGRSRGRVHLGRFVLDDVRHLVAEKSAVTRQERRSARHPSRSESSRHSLGLGLNTLEANSSCFEEFASVGKTWSTQPDPQEGAQAIVLSRRWSANRGWCECRARSPRTNPLGHTSGGTSQGRRNAACRKAC